MDGRLRNMTAVYITRGEEMLLLYRVGSRVVAPSYCGIGGHFEEAELNAACCANSGKRQGLRKATFRV